MGITALLVPPLLFFALGAAAQGFRSDLKFPADLSRALSIYLMIGIGLHGGAELVILDRPRSNLIYCCRAIAHGFQERVLNTNLGERLNIIF